MPKLRKPYSARKSLRATVESLQQALVRIEDAISKQPARIAETIRAELQASALLSAGLQARHLRNTAGSAPPPSNYAPARQQSLFRSRVDRAAAGERLHDQRLHDCPAARVRPHVLLPRAARLMGGCGTEQRNASRETFTAFSVKINRGRSRPRQRPQRLRRRLIRRIKRLHRQLRQRDVDGRAEHRRGGEEGQHT